MILIFWQQPSFIESKRDAEKASMTQIENRVEITTIPPQNITILFTKCSVVNQDRFGRREGGGKSAIGRVNLHEQKWFSFSLYSINVSVTAFWMAFLMNEKLLNEKGEPKNGRSTYLSDYVKIFVFGDYLIDPFTGHWYLQQRKWRDQNRNLFFWIILTILSISLLWTRLEGSG